jgi:CubicO group peptidase (beta-lactamase class C family)
VCGIAGVVTVLGDLAVFLRYMLDTSTAPARAGFGAEWTACSLIVQSGGLEPARGLFWLPAPGTADEQDVWVHYGFTGTGMWISPRLHRWAVLLTNELCCTRDRRPLTGVRSTFRQLAFS